MLSEPRGQLSLRCVLGFRTAKLGNGEGFSGDAVLHGGPSPATKKNAFSLFGGESSEQEGTSQLGGERAQSPASASGDKGLCGGVEWLSLREVCQAEPNSEANASSGGSGPTPLCRMGSWVRALMVLGCPLDRKNSLVLLSLRTRPRRGRVRADNQPQPLLSVRLCCSFRVSLGRKRRRSRISAGVRGGVFRVIPCLFILRVKV